jgi:hypothetical protein
MEVIGKKTCKQIQAGDVLEVSHNQICYWQGAYERLVTVISVEIKDLRNFDGTHVMGKTYVLTCSDGNTYEIDSRATKYRIHATEVK